VELLENQNIFQTLSGFNDLVQPRSNPKQLAHKLFFCVVLSTEIDAGAWPQLSKFESRVQLQCFNAQLCQSSELVLTGRNFMG